MKMNLVDCSSLYLKQEFFSLPEFFHFFLSDFHHLCIVVKYILCIFKNDTNISWELFLPGHMSQLPERCSGCLHTDGKHVDLRVLLLTADYF